MNSIRYIINLILISILYVSLISCGLYDSKSPAVPYRLDLSPQIESDYSENGLKAILSTRDFGTGNQRFAVLLISKTGFVTNETVNITTSLVQKNQNSQQLQKKTAIFYQWENLAKGTYVANFNFNKSGTWEALIEVLNENNNVTKSTDIKFSNSELTMASELSHYPTGIDKGVWKLISWPSQPGNTSLAVSTLEQGHVFHSWNPVKEVYSYPTEIEIGHSYWFKHRYKDAVIFEEDTATAIPLDSFVIDLRSGWNLIGSPFSFPVEFEKDSIVSDPITYGLLDKPSGWSGPQNELMPWNGYAVYSAQAAAITILPFSDPDSSAARIVSTNGWYLNIKLESDTYFNHSTEIGRRKYANNSYDHFDTPLFPEIDEGISLAMDLNGSGLFNYQRDIRDIEAVSYTHLTLPTNREV